MALYRKITIVGVGLLGGSVGLAIKKNRMADHVTGFFRHPRKIKDAKRLGCVDDGTSDFDEAVRDSDLIVLGSPVDDIVKRLVRLRAIGSPALITDTGSTKREIVKAAGNLNFVGAHPLAGSEQSGAHFAKADLLQGNMCILTPRGNGKKDVFRAISGFWRALGARTVVMDAQTHDKILGFTSHLPHAAAYALMQAMPEDYMNLCGKGLKDTTRIALSKPEIWCGILLSNRVNMLKTLRRFEASLADCKDAIAHNDRKKLLRWLTRAQQKRKYVFIP